MNKEAKKTEKNIATNRKARHEYAIHETWEAGISLVGTEVKSCRQGKVNLSDGWVDLLNQIPILNEVHIGHYSHGNLMNHPEKRQRKLLLSKSEIRKLAQAVERQGMTIIPLEMYFKKNWIKVLIGTARGKKAHDKRESNKERDAQRQMQRALREKYGAK